MKNAETFYSVSKSMDKKYVAVPCVRTIATYWNLV